MEPLVSDEAAHALVVSEPLPGTSVLSRTVDLAETVVLVDGIGRAGKGMLGPILSSFERVEIERVEEIFEFVGIVYQLRKMTVDAAVMLLKTEVDRFLYNSMIARNTNIRPADHSSVWRNAHPLRYLKRLMAPEGEDVIRRVRRERPIFQTMTHDQLTNFALFREAFGERLRVVEVIRHPVDLVYSWWKKGWGTRYGEDPTALAFCLRYEGRDLPYYAMGWECEYLSATPVSRIVRMIAGLWEADWRVFSTLPPEQRRQVFWVPFESFIQQPMDYVPQLAAFLGTRPSKATPRLLRRQGCPRPDRFEDRQRKRDHILPQLTDETRAILDALCHDYDTLVKTVSRSLTM